MSLITRTSLGLPVLPPDVQYQLFPFIRPDRNLLKTCTIVCKQWERLLTPDLFNTFKIGQDHLHALSLTDIAGRLAKAPERITRSFTTLRVQSDLRFSLHLLVSFLACLPNVHTLDLLDTDLDASLDDPAFSLSSKFSLRSLTISYGSVLTRDYDLLMVLLGCFDRLDRLRLVSTNVPPSWLPGAWPSLPKVKNLSVGPLYNANLPLLLRMVQQPGFSKHLVGLCLNRCVCKWDTLPSVADILRALKGTLQIFRFFSMFGFNASRPAAHDAADIEQTCEYNFGTIDICASVLTTTFELTVADELAACTALRELRLTMLSSPPGGCTGTFQHLSDTFNLYCLLIRRVAQDGLPVTVDFRILLDHNSDPWGFDQAMAKCDWAQLDEAASHLVRRRDGRTPLTLRFTRWDRQEEREQSRRMMEARVAAMDWRHYLPKLTDPKDPKVDLSRVQWGPASWEP